MEIAIDTIIQTLMIYMTVSIITYIAIILSTNSIERTGKENALIVAMSLLFPVTYIIMIFQWIYDNYQYHKRKRDHFKCYKRKDKIYIELQDRTYILDTETAEVQTNLHKGGKII